MFINGQNWNTPQEWMETGWLYNQNNPCGIYLGNGEVSPFSAFWAYTSTSAIYQGTVNYSCASYNPSGDNNYAAQYNPATGVWTHLFNGIPIHSEYASNPVGYTSQPETGYGTIVGNIAAFGQTTTTFMQMGGSDINDPILVSGISYADPNGNWVSVTNYQGVWKPNPFYLSFDINLYPFYSCPQFCPYTTNDNEQGIWWVEVYDSINHA